MSRGGDTRFSKGRSGNPAGRPKMRRPHVSAFDIIIDKMLTVTQNGVERELTIDEALQLQTYQAALKGSRMAVRQVLKMIEKRELAIAKLAPPAKAKGPTMEVAYDSDNANEALCLLDIAGYAPPSHGGEASTRSIRLTTWAAQAAISRPGRARFDTKDSDDIKRLTLDADKLKWPRSRIK